MSDDDGGRKLLEYFRQKGVSTSGILRVRDWTTTTNLNNQRGVRLTLHSGHANSNTQAAGTVIAGNPGF